MTTELTTEADGLLSLRRKINISNFCIGLGLILCLGGIQKKHTPARPLTSEQQWMIVGAVVGGFLLLGGFCGFVVTQSDTDALKQRMVDYANLSAKQEGKTRDLGFLHYFDSKNRGPTEEEIACRAYVQMIAWEQGGRANAKATKPAVKAANSGPSIVCPACETVNDADSQYCKKCGRSLAA